MINPRTITHRKVFDNDKHINSEFSAPDLLLLTEEKRFETVFRIHYPALCQFANTYLKDPEASADLVQDIFLKLWESRALDENLGHLQSWLYALVRNRCIDTLRRKSVQEKRIGKYTWHTEQWQDEEVHELTRNETTRQLKAAIDALPEETRLIIMQHFWEGHNYMEIAKNLQSNYDKIQKKGARAIQQLKKQIKPYFLLTLFLLSLF